jgi:hypothetical protein
VIELSTVSALLPQLCPTYILLVPPPALDCDPITTLNPVDPDRCPIHTAASFRVNTSDPMAMLPTPLVNADLPRQILSEDTAALFLPILIVLSAEDNAVYPILIAKLGSEPAAKFARYPKNVFAKPVDNDAPASFPIHVLRPPNPALDAGPTATDPEPPDTNASVPMATASIPLAIALSPNAHDPAADAAVFTPTATAFNPLANARWPIAMASIAPTPLHRAPTPIDTVPSRAASAPNPIAIVPTALDKVLTPMATDEPPVASLLSPNDEPVSSDFDDRPTATDCPSASEN